MGLVKYHKKEMMERNVKPKVRIVREGLALGVGCRRQFFKKMKSVDLFYDKDAKEIGMLPVKDADWGAFRFKWYENRNKVTLVGRIHCRGFLKACGLEKYVNKKSIEVYKKGEFIIVSLEEIDDL